MRDPTTIASPEETGRTRSEATGPQRNRRRPTVSDAPTPPRGYLRRALVGAVGRARALLSSAKHRAIGFAQTASRVVIAGLVVAGVAMAVREAEHRIRATDAFAVDELVVSGLTRLDEETVLEAAGIARGQNVLARTPAEVEAALLAHPRIAEATVERRLPGTWRLEVVEHVPTAVVALAGPCPRSRGARGDAPSPAPACSGALVLLSSEGVPFDALAADEALDLPVVTGISPERFRARPAWRTERLVAVAALLRDWNAVGLGERVTLEEVHVEEDGDLSVVVGDDGLLLRLGSGPFRPILERARVVLRALARRRAAPAYVLLDDPRHPHRVVVGMRD